MEDGKIDITGLDKSEVLATLYNNSRTIGLGFLQAKDGIMQKEDAAGLLKETSYFDYLYGKVMKVDLSGDSFDPWLYDRDNGTGKAEQLIEALYGEKHGK